MDRRKAIKLMAAVSVAGVLPNVVQSEETKLPVIKFQNMEHISNIDEIFGDIELKIVSEKGIKRREVLAWLPRDRAMAVYEKEEHYYGEVLLLEIHEGFFRDGVWNLCRKYVNISITKKTMNELSDGVQFYADDLSILELDGSLK